MTSKREVRRLAAERDYLVFEATKRDRNYGLGRWLLIVSPGPGLYRTIASFDTLSELYDHLTLGLGIEP